jgi:hypothetical protein
MLGIDDNNPDSLRIIPRYPVSWNEMSISDFPVLTGNKRQKINYSYLRNSKGQLFKYQFERFVKNLSLRLGPLPENKSVLKATVNGKSVDFETLKSGDSRWVWLKNLSGFRANAEIIYK